MFSTHFGSFPGHNVLAKRKNFYVPGVIVPTSLPCSVLVDLKYPEGQQQLYQDIFSGGRFDVVSDRVPSLADVSGCTNCPDLCLT